MAKYHRLTLKERYQIEALLNSGLSIRQIAHQLRRYPSTICREMRRMAGTYQASRSEKRCHYFRTRPRWDILKLTGDLKNYVIEKLLLDWSPDQIAGSLAQQAKKKVLSHQTIYRFIQADKAVRGRLWKHLRVLRKQRKDRKKVNWSPRKYMPDRLSIEYRPMIVEKRKRLGDIERDTLLGKHNGPLLLTLVDRTSRLLKMQWLACKNSTLVHEATVGLLQDEIVKTITNDNGSEFALHQQTAHALKTKIYFAHSYRAWERGTNENTNGLLRQYFPRKKDIGQVSSKQLAHIAYLINTRPKKCLGYRTPLEVHQTLKRQVLR